MSVRSPAFVAAAVVLALSAATALAREEAHWSYAGATGPTRWAALEHEYGTCGLGREQSPIDVREDCSRGVLSLTRYSSLRSDIFESPIAKVAIQRTASTHRRKE